MLDPETFWLFLRAGNTHEAHNVLDAASPGSSSEDRFTIAHLRSAALRREGRFAEAVGILRSSRADFPCQTVSHDGVARLLEHMGRRDEAISELRSAPFESERDSFPLLVADARFLLLYLLSRAGQSTTDPSIEEFADDFETMVPNAHHVNAEFVSKKDLQDLIDRLSD